MLVYFCYFGLSVLSLININMDTYHAAYWADPSYSSSDEEDSCYNQAEETDLAVYERGAILPFDRFVIV